MIKAGGTETTAIDKGDHYLLNGGKVFITNVAQQRQYRDDEQAGRHQDDGDSTVGPPALGPVRLVMLAHPVIVTAGTRSRAARGRTLSP